MGVLLEKLNKNEYSNCGFCFDTDIVAKTHDMTRWDDNKRKTLNRKKDRNYKMHSMELED